ncbi:MAG: virulence protein RhuM/Fic/DOC family protein [Candidatus Kerfeldbacteria bacterium]|nr:virulence protein RhuM/Fic/DOC family protein [Candidatus Kerfeldbacteria bacterium]
MKPKKFPNNQVVIYQTKTGAIKLKGDVQKDTIWANQTQIADIFNIERSVVTKHIRNILKDKELDERSVCANFAHTGNDGKIYQVQFYNLDIILALGYRTNSKRAIEFRKWATKVLREHITKGFTINKTSIKHNYTEFQKAIENIKQLLPVESNISHGDVLELISTFADTWLSLDAYDRDALADVGASKKSVKLNANEFITALALLKQELIRKGETTDIFALEKNTGSIEGIIGNVMQSFGGKAVYPTIEEKAAHLLYFMIKNHPFVDGNKRSGAYAFIWFLKKARLLNTSKITPAALTVLTLLIAESDPKNKQRMVRLVLQLLKK